MILHIHNGDATADVARKSSIPGEHFAWREALIEGPAPSGINEAEWRRRRAEHLANAYGVERGQCEQELIAQEQKLATSSDYDEVVLWFEHDVFCQVNLLYLLQSLGQHPSANRKLSLICIGSFPGKENFRGLGELNAEELESLFPGRKSVTEQQLDLAATGWEAYRSSDPRDVQDFASGDVSSLPFVADALRAHLKRFPSTVNGLGQIENRALQLISSGAVKFGDLFDGFSRAEPIYGLGDAQFGLALRRMSDANQPLIRIANGHSGDVEAPEATLALTDLGKAVMRGQADFVMLNGIDQWLGGVYLSGERNLWRWDQERQQVVLT